MPVCAGAPSHAQASYIAACTISIGNIGKALEKCFDNRFVDLLLAFK